MKKSEPLKKVYHNEKKATLALGNAIADVLATASNRDIVFFCIGTDRSTGDSLGPLVGSALKGRLPANVHVVGTLHSPVHAVNLKEEMDEVNKRFNHPFIIAVDACLGRSQNIGSLSLVEGPVKPGAGVGKNLPEVGEYHLIGIVNESGFMEFFTLQNTRLHLVMQMADVLTKAILHATKTDNLIHQSKAEVASTLGASRPSSLSHVTTYRKRRSKRKKVSPFLYKMKHKE